MKFCTPYIKHVIVLNNMWKCQRVIHDKIGPILTKSQFSRGLHIFPKKSLNELRGFPSVLEWNVYSETCYANSDQTLF